MNTMKKFIALVLTLFLLISLVPLTVSAQAARVTISSNIPNHQVRVWIDNTQVDATRPFWAVSGAVIDVQATAMNASKGLVFVEWLVVSGNAYFERESANFAHSRFSVLDSGTIEIRAIFREMVNPIDVIGKANDATRGYIQFSNERVVSANMPANLSLLEPGTTVILRAFANAGYVFERWEVVSGNISLIPRPLWCNSEFRFTVPQSGTVEVKAIFRERLNSIEISVNTNNLDWGNASPSIREGDFNRPIQFPSQVEPGTTVRLEASASPGFIFDRWEVISGNVTLVQGHVWGISSFVTPQSGSVEILAVFREMITPISVSVITNYQRYGYIILAAYTAESIHYLTQPPHMLEPGMTIILREIANPGFIFESWEVISGNVTLMPYPTRGPNSVRFTIPQTGPVEIHGIFRSIASMMFADISQNAWYARYVEIVTSEGLLAGMPDGRFDPQGNMTRAMFTQVLANMEGSIGSHIADFNDVPPGAWFSNAVGWAANSGIVGGVGNNNFAPNAPVTREQVAVMLVNYINHKGYTLPTPGQPIVAFTDEANISDWALNSVRLIQSAGIIGGRPDGSFAPQDTMTRAEVSAIFSRLIRII